MQCVTLSLCGYWTRGTLLALVSNQNTLYNVMGVKTHLSVNLPQSVMKGTKRYLFCSWKRCSQKREKGTFSAVGSDVVKSAKKVHF